MPRRSIIALLLLISAASCKVISADPEAGRDARGPTGAVTAGHPLAAAAGLEVLRNGGNAMDAAITMAAVLSVARPHMNGVGGDMFLIYYDEATGKAYALNASGRSGSAATLADLRARGLDAMPETGPLSVSVPGAVGGWAEALRRFGTMSWSEALEPAVQLARAGLPVSERLSLDIAGQAAKVRRDPEAARIFLPGGAPPEAGQKLQMPELAATLERIQQNGPEEFYHGETGERVVEYLTERGGLLRAEDLAAYEPVWIDPLRGAYRDYEVLALPPNTQGVALLAELGILNWLDLKSLEHNSADYLHTITEAIRFAVADRDSSIADPDAMRVTVDQLLDKDRLRRFALGIDPKGMAPESDAQPDTDHPNTVYVSVADENGNVVSLIQSLFHSFGSGLVVPGTGIVLHNRGSLFRFDESHPNVFAPRRRPYHTLSPAMMLREGVPVLAFGTPGGDGQTHTLIQLLNNILLFGMNPQQAIDAPRLRRLPDGSLAIEDRVPAEVLAALGARGYNVLPRSGWTAEFGGAQIISIDPETGAKRAGADRRREGWSLAY
ncbi:MAG: gamma-glutamyltransferase [Gemmatimonadetes bacterium]|nr:gamma-glutamyltransferase [Gemmatimonadota bacterium]